MQSGSYGNSDCKGDTMEDRKCGCVCIDDVFNETLAPDAQLREMIQKLKERHNCSMECACFDDCALEGSLDDLLYQKETSEETKENIKMFLEVFSDRLEEIQLI